MVALARCAPDQNFRWSRRGIRQPDGAEVSREHDGVVVATRSNRPCPQRRQRPLLLELGRQALEILGRWS